MRLYPLSFKKISSLLIYIFHVLAAQHARRMLAIVVLAVGCLAIIPQAAQAALQSKTGTFAANSGTGHQTITGVGFVPKAVLFWYTDRTGPGTNNNARFGRGWATGPSAQGAVATAWEDTTGTVDTRERITNTRCITLIDHDSNLLTEAEMVSLDSDGFTINWTLNGGSRLIVYLALGGDSLLAKVGGELIPWQAPNSQFDITGVGFQPEMVLLMGCDNKQTSWKTYTRGGHAFGVAISSSKRHSSGHRWRDGQYSSSGTSGVSDNYALVGADDKTTPENAYDLVTMLSDGFRLKAYDPDGDGDVDATGMIYLALSGLQVDIGILTQPTVTGTQSVSGLSFEPSVVLFDGGDKPLVGFAVHAEAVVGVAQNSSQQAGIWIGSDSKNSDVAFSTTYAIMSYKAGSANLEARAKLSSIDVDGFTLNWDTVDSKARKIGWIALGAPGATVFGVSPATITLMANETKTGSISGGTTPYAVISSDTSKATVTLSGNTFIVAGVAAGTANITISDDAGGSAVVAVTVTPPLTVSLSILNLIPGTNGVTIVSGGQPAYAVISGNTTVATAAISGSTVTITGAATGSISVSITDQAGNNVMVSVNVSDSIAPGLATCPVPPFTTSGVGPNVLFILDQSGSMGNGPGSKWENAKEVLRQIIADNPNIRFGLMRLDGSNASTLETRPDNGIGLCNDCYSTSALCNGQSHYYTSREGGKIVRPCGTPGSEIINYIDTHMVEENNPRTMTTVAESLATAGQYFATVEESGNRVGKGPANFGYYQKNYQYWGTYANGRCPVAGDTIYDPTITDDFGNTINTLSPISSACEKNFVIMLTDGQPTDDGNWTVVKDIIGDYAGNGGANLDDVAKYLYDNDMRSDLPGKQNIISYFIGFGFSASSDTSFLSNAAAGGGGLFFRSDNNFAALTSALQSILRDIMAKISSGTAVATITTSSQTDDYLVRAKFFPGSSWMGFIERYTLPYLDTATADWEAGALLNSRVAGLGYTDRKIYTFISGQNPTKQLFTSANGAVKTSLAGLWGRNFTETADVINYIRGDTTYDGGKYKDRKDWLLGDMVYSTPVAVAAPKGWFFGAQQPEYASYQVFKDANAGRKTMIYVGANDGMLHAFDAADGHEDWAFIPEKIQDKLIDLTVADCHKYYVDLSPYVADAWFGTSAADVQADGSNWKTMLIGGNRLGGMEYFALDVTNPAPDQFSALWDVIPFPGKLSSTLPVVGKVKANAGAVDRWVAVITSGYHGSTDPGQIAALNITDGTKSAIWYDGIGFVDTLTTQAQGAYIAGSPYYTMSSPAAVDSDLDGYLDLIYAGDTEGSLWKFYYDYANDAWKKTELFNTGGQAITATPALAFDKNGVLRIYFGTGKYVEDSDKDNTTRNAFYCLVDEKQYPGNANDGHYTGTASLTGQLVDITATVTKVQFGGLDTTAQATATGKGWYFELDDPSAAGFPAERVLGKATIVSGIVFFTSFVPNQDVCGYGGNARVYAIDYITGTVDEGQLALENMDTSTRHQDIGVGIPSEPVFYFDPLTKTARLIIQKSDSDVEDPRVNLKERPMLIQSWRDGN